MKSIMKKVIKKFTAYVVPILKLLGTGVAISMMFFGWLFICQQISEQHKRETPQVTVWHYQGHDMLRYEYNGSTSVCHSPECRKCVQVYD